MVTDPAESDDMPNSSNRTPESAEEERGVATEDLGEAPSDVMEAAAAADPLAESRAESQRFKDQWMRTAADFDNFRKRARREVDDARKAGREELLRELLPVFDNLERALASAQRASDIKGVAEGLRAEIEKVELSFTQKAGENGKLFGSVTNIMIAEKLAEQGVKVDRHNIQTEPIRSTGSFKVPVKVHRDVTASVRVVIVAEQAEGATAANAAEPETAKAE